MSERPCFPRDSIPFWASISYYLWMSPNPAFMTDSLTWQRTSIFYLHVKTTSLSSHWWAHPFRLSSTMLYMLYSSLTSREISPILSKVPTKEQPKRGIKKQWSPPLSNEAKSLVLCKAFTEPASTLILLEVDSSILDLKDGRSKPFSYSRSTFLLSI